MRAHPPSPSDAIIAIVGAGRTGSSLARAAQRAGLDVTLAGRDNAADACRRADAALLCVPDDAIADACEACAALRADTPALVGHVSGASTLEVLAATTAGGAEAFSLHPLQTFPDAATEVAGMPCAVAGSSADAERFATELGLALEMRPFEVPEESRAAYHAAASVASNLLVALEESAADLLARAGVEDARELLAPLVLQTAANWADRGADALTGPIARSDAATVERHLEAIADLAPELRDAYEALAERAAATKGATA